MTKKLFEHEFENGNRVEVTNKGLTLWDAKVGRWVFDASSLVEDNTMRVFNELKGVPESSWVDFPTFYPELKAKRKKKRKSR